jgi:outer membrane biosynthesis protein TonB
MNERKKRNSSKVNLTISIVFHTLLVLGLFYFAARQGILGKKLKEITVTMAPKEKKPEPPKEKPVAPKVEPPKPVETPKVAATAPPPRVETHAPPPPADTAPASAPAAVQLPAFNFDDGAHEVQTVSDPKVIYKGVVEHALRSRWNRPEDIADDNYVAEVELAIDHDGNVSMVRWVKGSGDSRWDNSVRAAIAATKVISRPPPKGFPGSFIARFDVESLRTEEVIHLSSR